MKIKLEKDGTISRKEYEAIETAMSVLGNCIFPPSGGHIDKNGVDRIQIFMIPEMEDVIEALDTMSSIFGLELREGKM